MGGSRGRGREDPAGAADSRPDLPVGGDLRQCRGARPFQRELGYWPVRVRVKGGVKSRLTGLQLLAPADGAAKEKPQPVEFVEEARLATDDFGKWRVSYNCDARGPIWRLGKPEAARAAR